MYYGTCDEPRETIALVQFEERFNYGCPWRWHRARNHGCNPEGAGCRRRPLRWRTRILKRTVAIDMKRHVKGVVVDLVSTESDESRFCGKLSADVNQGPLFLSRVMVLGKQIYPRLETVLGGADIMVRAELRIRDASGDVSARELHDVFQRLMSYEVVDAHTIDEHGAIIERIEVRTPAAS